MSTSDRELLELAAKAAGLKVRIWEGHTGVMCAVDDDCHGRMWMPHIDDGDALRLAVKLRLQITAGRMGCCIRGFNGSYVTEPFMPGCDEMVVARRAIVRAAAEIGRSMK